MLSLTIWGSYSQDFYSMILLKFLKGTPKLFLELLSFVNSYLFIDLYSRMESVVS